MICTMQKFMAYIASSFRSGLEKSTLDATVSCISVNDTVITVNDPIYGTVSADIRNAVILNTDGGTAELSDIKNGAELKVTYVSQPSGGKAEICKIIINQ